MMWEEFHVLSKSEYDNFAKKPLLELCGKEESEIGNPFPSVQQTLVLGPDFANDLFEPKFFELVSRIAIEIGDNGFFVRKMGEFDHNFKVPDKPPFYYPFSYVPFSQFLGKDDYNDFWFEKYWLGTVEYVLYSPKAIWGIIAGDEMGVIGGTNEFVEKIINAIPEIQNSVFSFLQYFDHYRKLSKKYSFPWIPELLFNAYGKQRSSEILRIANWQP